MVELESTSNAEDRDDRSETMRILQELEQGQIDVEQAERLLIDVEAPQEQEHAQAVDTQARWKAWWVLPLSIGIGLTVSGVGMLTLDGMWWLCGGPMVMAGVLLMTVSAATHRSPWIHVRIFNKRGSGPRKIAVSLPIPVRFTAWLVRRFGQYVKPLQKTGVDELVLALDMLHEGISPEGPLFVEVEDDEDGERIEVYLG